MSPIGFTALAIVDLGGGARALQASAGNKWPPAVPEALPSSLGPAALAAAAVVSLYVLFATSAPAATPAAARSGRPGRAAAARHSGVGQGVGRAVSYRAIPASPTPAATSHPRKDEASSPRGRRASPSSPRGAISGGRGARRPPKGEEEEDEEAAAAAAAAAVAAAAPRRPLPSIYPVLVLGAFASSVLWMDLLASELVALMEAVGISLGAPDHI